MKTADPASEFKMVTLHIEGVSLDKLPLASVGEYMVDFAGIFGGVDVHYHQLTRGTLTLKAKYKKEQEVDINSRVFLLRSGDAPEEAIRARDRISRRMGIHHAKRASILNSRDEKVIEIPVIREDLVPAIPGLVRYGSLQGRIVSIRGKADKVSVELLDVDGHVYFCKAGKELRRELAREAFDPVVRVHGYGKWVREENGAWRVEDFRIEAFDILEDDTLSSVVQELRAVNGNWKEVRDPWPLLAEVRDGDKSL